MGSIASAINEKSNTKVAICFMFLLCIFLLPVGCAPTLFETLKKDDSGALEKYLKNNGDPNLKTKDGDPALKIAVKSGKLEPVRILIENGADVNLTDSIGDSALHKACYLVGHKTAELLIENGAEVNLTNNYGMTPLHVAIRFGRFRTAELLIDNGADVNACSKESNFRYKTYTPLIDAVRYEPSSYLRESTQINFTDKMNRIVKLLIDNGADVNACCKNTFPLAEALKVEYAETLLENGAEIHLAVPSKDHPNKEYTLLENAVSRRYDAELISLLLKAGARRPENESWLIPSSMPTTIVSSSGKIFSNPDHGEFYKFSDEGGNYVDVTYYRQYRQNYGYGFGQNHQRVTEKGEKIKINFDARHGSIYEIETHRHYDKWSADVKEIQ